MKEEALALELPVDPLQMCVLPIISKLLPLAAEAASHIHLSVSLFLSLSHTHTNLQISWQQNREGDFFFLRAREGGGRKEIII